MPFLYPQLLAEVGRRNVAELSTASVEEARRKAETRSPDPAYECVYSATGGTPVTPDQLAELRKDVVAIASEQGFPAGNRRDNLKCDAAIAVCLRERMGITPHEAANPGIWEYLTCVLLPDVAVWRFRDGNGRTSQDRLLAGRRNNFQRLWWRAYLLAGHLDRADATAFLMFLTEDDMVATLERPGLFGYRRMMRSYYAEFRRMVEAGTLGAPREAVNRDVHKRLLRAVAIRELDALPDEDLQKEVLELIAQSVSHVTRAPDRGNTARVR